MGTPRADRAAELVTELQAAGLKATRSVAAALQQLPCVLVPPPALEAGSYGGPTVTWKLVVLAADPLGDVDSWLSLDAQLDQLLAVVPFDRADPVAYQLPTGGDPLPAYAVTYTES